MKSEEEKAVDDELIKEAVESPEFEAAFAALFSPDIPHKFDHDRQ